MTRVSRTNGSSDAACLREVLATDLRWMAEMAADRELVGPHNWRGERPVEEIEAELREEFAARAMIGTDHGLLIVTLEDGTPVGDVSWRTERWGPTMQSKCPAIGVALLPEFRGRGLGTVAQRLLVDRLFTEDPSLHRVQSDTAVDNIAEHRALEKVGFVVEGRVRDAEYRDGGFHDHLLYSILRSEWDAWNE